MAKKSFKADINPAMNFISQESIDRAEAPASVSYKPIYTETKSKRLQSLIQPTTYEKLKRKAIKEKISVNELVNRILQEALEEE